MFLTGAHAQIVRRIEEKVSLVIRIFDRRNLRRIPCGILGIPVVERFRDSDRDVRPTRGTQSRNRVFHKDLCQAARRRHHHDQAPVVSEENGLHKIVERGGIRRRIRRNKDVGLFAVRRNSRMILDRLQEVPVDFGNVECRLHQRYNIAVCTFRSGQHLSVPVRKSRLGVFVKTTIEAVVSPKTIRTFPV